MVLFNENRNRAPLVPVAPRDGDVGVRGDLKMIETPGDTNLYVCVTAGEDLTAAEVDIGAGDSQIHFESVNQEAASNDVTVTLSSTGADQALSISVVGTDITVELETAGGVNQTTVTELVTAINNDTDASALVTASIGAAGDGSGVVADAIQTSLAGGGTSSVWTTK